MGYSIRYVTTRDNLRPAEVPGLTPEPESLLEYNNNIPIPVK